MPESVFLTCPPGGAAPSRKSFASRWEIMFLAVISARTFVHGTGARRLPRYRSSCPEFFLGRKKTRTRALFRRKTNRYTFQDWNGSSGFPRQTSANSFEEAPSNAQNGAA